MSEYNHKQGLTIEERGAALYALEPWEKIIDGEVIDNSEEYQQQQAQAEQERINKLTMTALDLINLIKSQGVDDMTIYQYLQENITLNLQLTYCQNVYCGVVRQLLPLTVGNVTITDELIVNAFKIKNQI